MRPLRYSINVSLDGCVDHADAGFVPGPEVHQHAADWLASNDVGLFGRVTFGLMEAWRPNDQGELDDWIEPWMVPFAETIGELDKVVVSTTLQDPGWNTVVVGGAGLDDDGLEALVRDLKEPDGAGIGLGGADLALQLARLGLIDEYQLVIHPVVAGHGPYLFAGLREPLGLTQVGRDELPGGVVALRYEPTRQT